MTEEQQARQKDYEEAVKDILLSSVCNRFEIRTRAQQLKELEEAYASQEES